MNSLKWIPYLRLITLAALVSVAHGKDKPNVILIFADDISARELPFYGSSTWTEPSGRDTQDPNFQAKTPVFDKLAEEGVWVTNAWAATVCSPSRAMMMTGRYANLHKWWHNNDYGKIDDGTKWPKPVALYLTSPLQIGHLAQQAGYATQWSGKTQMKHCDYELFGFDEGCFTPGSYLFGQNPHTDFQLIQNKGKKTQTNLDTGEEIDFYAQASWYWQPSVALMNHPSNKEAIEWWPNTPESKKSFGLTTYAPDVEMDFIFEFIERKHAEGKPFFIYHTEHLGHDGFDYLDPTSGSMWPGTPVVEWDGEGYTRIEPKITGDKGVYDTHGTVSDPGIHKHVEYLDYHVWLYMEKLKEMGIEDNTIIIFCADNGTWKYGKSSHDRQKGTHVPFLIYAPGQNLTKQGEQDILVSLADILPTLADIMGTEIPEDYEIHGESLWPYLTSDQEKHRDWIYAYKSDKQLIRGDKVMLDGYGKWWDVSETPDDLISFAQITDWETASPEHRAERDRLSAILPDYDNYHTEHDPVIQ
ncbi:sulfatase-like hydrolase/transferase [Rubellicoccus peritrichatus]|uniref:Sulfatase-like hydrolase/transferase n=1 Tax=Rubellicoccus peritrichatus TaxID=3080537 RepID=A0AAQ3QVA6_9BACT|nr:sulfatase-like hydrolase/transferase [Puniceicoccus sp. CR14]WOO40667.1 sulfatase-like hydrolase/transferase [Puniceicoccus sp. CR14]